VLPAAITQWAITHLPTLFFSISQNAIRLISIASVFHMHAEEGGISSFSDKEFHPRYREREERKEKSRKGGKKSAALPDGTRTNLCFPAPETSKTARQKAERP
jgi:hypothetical protein